MAVAEVDVREAIERNLSLRAKQALATAAVTEAVRSLTSNPSLPA